MKKKTAKQIILEILQDSKIEISIVQKTYYNGKVCEYLRLSISGKASAIPSLKNSKIPKTNFTNPITLARIKALDILFNRKQVKSIWSKDEKISLIILNGKRLRHYDPIGCLETIQDWLEPATKKVGRAKKTRGWGIGLIKDDSQVVFGVSLRKEDLDESLKEHDYKLRKDDTTEILIFNGMIMRDEFFNYTKG